MPDLLEDFPSLALTGLYNIDPSTQTTYQQKLKTIRKMAQRRVPKMVQHSRRVSTEIEKKKKKVPMMTPPQMFHRAAQQGDLETCKDMVGKWMAAKTALGNTALHWASAAGHVEVVSFLIDAGCDVNMTNDMLDTPLHSAAWRGFHETAAVLLRAGCSREAVNKDRKTPPELAAQKFSEDHPIMNVLPKFTAEELAEIGGDESCEVSYVSSDDDSDVEASVAF